MSSYSVLFTSKIIALDCIEGHQSGGQWQCILNTFNGLNVHVHGANNAR